MKYVTLGRTGLSVSRIAFGTWQLGGDWGATDDAAAIQALQRSRELGVNFYDTAQGYGWGASERLLGKALRDDLVNRRSDVVIATKGGLNFTDGVLRRDSSPDWLRRGVEGSLEALGVDYIDIYQVHWPDTSTPFAKTAEALGRMVEEGLVRHVGVSNFDVEQMREFSDAYPVETLQPALSLLRRGVEREILPYCEEQNVGVLVYGPLAHGLLSGAARIGATYPPGDWRGGRDEFEGESFRRNVAVAERLAEYARETLDCSLSELALAWALSRPGVHAAIIGTRRADHLEQAARAADVTLDEQNIAAIEEIVADCAPLVGVTPESF